MIQLHHFPGTAAMVPQILRGLGIRPHVLQALAHLGSIASQYLQTNEAVGYVVIDIDAAHSDMALAKLADVQGTIRSRVLF